MRDHYTLLPGPAVLVTTSGGLVHTYRHRGELEQFLAQLPRGAERFPGLLAAWDEAAPPPPLVSIYSDRSNPPAAPVEEALAMTARVAKQGA